MGSCCHCYRTCSLLQTLVLTFPHDTTPLYHPTIPQCIGRSVEDLEEAVGLAVYTDPEIAGSEWVARARKCCTSEVSGMGELGGGGTPPGSPAQLQVWDR
jgi:hypothetical protein